LTAVGPAWAVVTVAADPLSEWCSPTAVAKLSSTPVHEEIVRPPSVTDCAKYARTARISLAPGSVLGSGKFCTFVATYVAIEYPPAVTYSTSVYVLPTGV